MIETQINVQVNGEHRTFPAGTTITAMLQAMEINAARVAVEYNRKIVKPPSWGETILQSGDEIEVVHFVGGGL